MCKVEAEIWIEIWTSSIDRCTQNFRRQKREEDKGVLHRSTNLVINQATRNRTTQSDRPKEKLIMTDAWTRKTCVQLDS